MIHHALDPLGGRGGRTIRRLLEFLGNDPAVHIDFLTISDRPVYQSESIHSGVTTHRLNVYKKTQGKITADELFEFQAKSYIFILRTSRNVRYDLIHALGIFPEAYTAWAFRRRIPYALSLMPSTPAGAREFAALSGPCKRQARRVFNHTAGLGGPSLHKIAKSYLETYRR